MMKMPLFFIASFIFSFVFLFLLVNLTRANHEGQLEYAPASASETERVSINSMGEEGNGWSGGGAISADGRYVAFHSMATNLVISDTNVSWDVFVHDREMGITERISVAADGGESNYFSRHPVVSADGRYVALYSGASNLVISDTNGNPDIFVRDRLLGETELVSVSSTGIQGDSGSSFPAISADGRFVTFSSNSTTLVVGDNNGWGDVFVHDRLNDTTELASVSSSGVQGNWYSYSVDISDDGRYVVFFSRATNLVADDTNSSSDIFLHDRETGETTRVSVSSTGEQGNRDSFSPAISGDGRYVAFISEAYNFVWGAGGFWHIFVHDRLTGITELASKSSTGVIAHGDCDNVVLSNNGRYVLFRSHATNLVPDDTNGTGDAFIHDRLTGLTIRVSVGAEGQQGNGGSTGMDLSADGQQVVFLSAADNLVSGDTNQEDDVFVREWYLYDALLPAIVFNSSDD